MRYNPTETTKNICCAKGEVAVDHSTATKWFKKYHSGWKNFDDEA